MAETGLTAKKSEDFGEWYTQLITRGGLIDYYDVSGCYILRPDSFEVWEQVQAHLGAAIKKMGVRNAYFPMFVTERALTTEADHIEDFAPEVAWVTRSGNSDLAEPIALRPTSETIIYPSFAKWIRSHRDLPLRINQWSNIVRWEFKQPNPFIRTREFLWQEGHSAFATKEEADKEVLAVLELYREAYEDLLAVPMIKGYKSEKEKFAGATYTTTIEGFVPGSGKAVQAATSHHLGQNFSNMFKIEYEDTDKKKQKVFQNSWGFTTRSLGVMYMIHGDDSGLVNPPRVAPVQVVIVPIPKKGVEEIGQKAEELYKLLKDAGIRVELDDRKYKPGWKYNYWELHGVPLRIELGARDLQKNQVFTATRFNRKKEAMSIDGLSESVKAKLDQIQKAMLEKAREERDERLKKITKWEEFVPTLNKKCFCKVPWCTRLECEEQIKKRSAEESVGSGDSSETSLTGAAKSLCIPFEQEPLSEGLTCFQCNQPATKWALFGRSY